MHDQLDFFALGRLAVLVRVDAYLAVSLALLAFVVVDPHAFIAQLLPLFAIIKLSFLLFRPVFFQNDQPHENWQKKKHRVGCQRIIKPN